MSLKSGTVISLQTPPEERWPYRQYRIATSSLERTIPRAGTGDDTDPKLTKQTRTGTKSAYFGDLDLNEYAELAVTDRSFENYSSRS